MPTVPEWVGGCFVVPGAIMDEAAPYHAEMAVWCEPDSGLVVGHELARPGGSAAALARAYRKAMEAPLAGPPHAPRRARVATGDLARALHATVGSGTTVVVAATPEIDELAAQFGEAVRAKLAEDEDEDDARAGFSDFTTGSYFHGGLVPAEIVADLFGAARVLNALAPWKIAANEHVVRADIPSLGIRGAAISILGNAGQSYGFLVLPDLAAFEAMAERMESGRTQRDGDFGTQVLALQLDRLDELPDRAAAEIEAHGWKDANGRYPWVQSREPDGSLVPVDAQKMKVVTAIALTLGTFCTQASEAFVTDGADAASMTIETDGSPTVRYTMPYEAFDEFGATPGGKRPRREKRRAMRAEVFDASPALPRPVRRRASLPLPPPPAVRARAKVGRNEPCPCGSGRKYKHCHLASDEASAPAPASAPADAPPASRWNEVLGRVFAYAASAFGAAYKRWPEDFRDPGNAEQLMLEWALFHVQVEGRTAAGAYLSDPSLEVPRGVRSFLEAQQSAWLSVWEVQSVERGQGFTARDLLTGEVRSVTDRKASECVAVRHALLGRVVEWEGRSGLWGVHDRILPPLATQHVIDAMRKRLRIGRAGRAPIEALQSHRAGKFLIACWEDAVERVEDERRHPPRMTTVDGEDLVLCTVVYEIEAGRRDEVLEALDRMPGLTPPSASERAGAEPTYAIPRPAGATRAKSDSLGESLMGQIRVRATELVLETNSRERCGALVPRLLEAVGPRVREKDRTEVDAREDYLAYMARVDAGTEPPRPKARLVPPAAILEKLQEVKREHYARWLDESIPALGGKTPRQAARLARSREQLDLLLRDMEHGEASLPEWERADLGAVRKELGL